MREEAVVQWAEDYEFLRERARAHLGGEGSAASELAARPRGNVRVISSAPTVDADPLARTPAPPRRRSEPARAPAPRSYGSRRGAAPTPRPAPPARAARPVQPARPPRRAVDAHRRGSPAIARVAAEPDRAALWAVMLGIFLALVAVATAHAAPEAHAHAAAAAQLVGAH